MVAAHRLVEQRVDAALKRTLRAQIARLERDLANALAITRVNAPRAIDHHGPRLLTVAELEQTRDALAARLLETRTREELQRDAQHEARARLDAMLADPAAHPYARVTNHELGLPGCTSYEVRPRLGLIGALAKWWRVKVSSGCP
jgi:hypothetical protein